MKRRFSFLGLDLALDLALLLFATLIAVFLFFDGTLDIQAARLFYHPGNSLDPWFEQNQPLWDFFYRAAPWLTAVLLLSSLLVLAATQFTRWGERFKKIRNTAVFIFLLVALGPGLFVNVVFKPYWGRPRPREVIELGGRHSYQPFYAPQVGAPGKSFPCGHCSVAFSYGAFAWPLAATSPLVAAAIFLGSLLFGALMGVSRMAAGGHFLSDVVWSGLMVYWLSFWLHRRLGGRAEQSLQQTSNPISQWLADFSIRNRKIVLGIYGMAGLFAILAVLLASPFNSEFQAVVGGEAGADRIQVDIERARVEMVVDAQMVERVKIEGNAKGFGFPGSKAQARCGASAEAVCLVNRKGFFSDYESVIRIFVNPSKVVQFRLNVHSGELYRAEHLKAPQFLFQCENCHSF
jgi:lipid A 4'-phosphatase